MVKFSELNSLNDELFQRIVGLPRMCFTTLVKKVKNEIESDKLKNPLKKRGLNSSFPEEDKILITLYYLRHYPTLEVLAGIFSISKSYVHIIYHKYSSMLVKLFHVEGAKALNTEALTTILMDVTEQPIERPKHGQKEYYSGKKSNILSKCN
jgi:hypothetical protein